VERHSRCPGLRQSPTAAAIGTLALGCELAGSPAPAEGGLFKRCWWRYWIPAHLHLPPVSVRMPDGEVRSVPAVQLPDRFDQVVQSWDLAFKDLATSDYVVGQVWAAVGADRFLLDQRRERMDMPRTVEAIRAMSEKWPQGAKWVEDRANRSYPRSSHEMPTAWHGSRASALHASATESCPPTPIGDQTAADGLIQSGVVKDALGRYRRRRICRTCF
jgi:hypothetical protein